MRTIARWSWSRCSSGVLNTACISTPHAPHASTISCCLVDRIFLSRRKASAIVWPPKQEPARGHHCFPHYSTARTKDCPFTRAHAAAHTRKFSHTQFLTPLEPQLHWFADAPCSRVVDTPYTPCPCELSDTLIRYRIHITTRKKIILPQNKLVHTHDHPGLNTSDTQHAQNSMTDLYNFFRMLCATEQRGVLCQGDGIPFFPRQVYFEELGISVQFTMLIGLCGFCWCASNTHRHLGSSTAANWVSFDFNVSYSSCWGYSLINTLKLKNKTHKSRHTAKGSTDETCSSWLWVEKSGMRPYACTGTQKPGCGPFCARQPHRKISVMNSISYSGLTSDEKICRETVCITAVWIHKPSQDRKQRYPPVARTATTRCRPPWLAASAMFLEMSFARRRWIQTVAAACMLSMSNPVCESPSHTPAVHTIKRTCVRWNSRLGRHTCTQTHNNDVEILQNGQRADIPVSAWPSSRVKLMMTDDFQVELSHIACRSCGVDRS